MKKWGFFTTKRGLRLAQWFVRHAGFEVSEVRALSLIEKVTYLADDPHLYLNDPHIIMFEATEEEYKRFIRRYRLSSVF